MFSCSCAVIFAELSAFVYLNAAFVARRVVVVGKRPLEAWCFISKGRSM